MALLSLDDGLTASTPEDAHTYEQMGYEHCPGHFTTSMTGPCDFWISPEAQQWVEGKGGYYTCPRCKMSFNLIHSLPWSRPFDDQYEEYYDSPSGLSKVEIGQMGEDILDHLGGLPGYGNWEWFHQGGSASSSPLDALLKDWGVEIKTLLYDAKHHRFIPGGLRPRVGEPYSEKESKNRAAQDARKKGVLGVLVLLDMRRSVADIYVKEMPLVGWLDAQGKNRAGITTFRTNTAVHLVDEVPFHNPYMDPNHPAPHGPEPAATPSGFGGDPFLDAT